MQKTIKRSLGLTCLCLSTVAIATPANHNLSINKDHQVLSAYLHEAEDVGQPFILNDRQIDPNLNVFIESYTLASQQWPKLGMDSHVTLWKHNLIIYRPILLKTSQALLFVNGGTRNPNSDNDNPVPHQLNFPRMAAETNSVVVDLQDIPNQYLTFDDNKARKEDAIVAYTWKKFLADPDQNAYWPVHLPMTKAVIKAMDAVQEIIASETNGQIKEFVVAGASKRGWATWLATLSDARINAIVPIVIDILNTKANIKHIYACYDNHWPPAFYDYVEEQIPEQLDSTEFKRMMKIEDPLTYIACKNCDFYKKRLRIPKYIISASGDDFYVPDSMNLYLGKLSGETNVRVVPNQGHHIDMQVVEDSLLPYYQSIINKTKRPKLHWTVSDDGKLQNISTNQKPVSIKLWEAENPNARDFRFTENIIYSAKDLQGNCINNHCHYEIHIDRPIKGWKSSFVEVTFGHHTGPLILTTPAYVLGNLPAREQISSTNLAK